MKLLPVNYWKFTLQSFTVGFYKLYCVWVVEQWTILLKHLVFHVSCTLSSWAFRAGSNPDPLILSTVTLTWCWNAVPWPTQTRSLLYPSADQHPSLSALEDITRPLPVFGRYGVVSVFWEIFLFLGAEESLPKWREQTSNTKGSVTPFCILSLNF